MSLENSSLIIVTN